MIFYCILAKQDDECGSLAEFAHSGSNYVEQYSFSNFSFKVILSIRLITSHLR